VLHLDTGLTVVDFRQCVDQFTSLPPVQILLRCGTQRNGRPCRTLVAMRRINILRVVSVREAENDMHILNRSSCAQWPGI
jgi:hypothetical protein